MHMALAGTKPTAVVAQMTPTTTLPLATVALSGRNTAQGHVAMTTSY